MRAIRAIAVMSLLLSSKLSADAIELKTGERIEGKFKQATADGAVIEIAGQAVTIPLDKVQAIYFGAPPARGTPGASTRTELHSVSAQDALDALRALRSVTNSGIAYREYSQKVLDARIKVDQCLAAPGAAFMNGGLKGAIELSMKEYELSSQAWNAQITSSVSSVDAIGMAIDQDPRISSCPSIRRLIDEFDQMNRRTKPVGSRATQIGIYLSVKPATLWPCASEQLSEAERLMANR